MRMWGFMNRGPQNELKYNRVLIIEISKKGTFFLETPDSAKGVMVARSSSLIVHRLLQATSFLDLWPTFI